MGAYGGTIEASKSPYDANYFQQASCPIPTDSAVDVSLNAILSWISYENAVAHEVYFGTSELPPFVQKEYETEFYPWALEPNTQYYWRIDDIDNMVNRVTGNIWNFLKGPKPAYAYNPNPANMSVGVKIYQKLSWSSGMNAVAHDVYFGTDFNDVNEATINNSLGVLISQGQENTNYAPGTLGYNRTYYWRVDEVDQQGNRAKGDIWVFITRNSPF